MATPLEILKQYWKYDQFRPLQEEIVQAVLDQGKVLALLPTGGGKSVCFQVPALCLEGVCLVISPLIALMKDQVEQLRSRGIKAVAVYSGMTAKEIDITLDNCIYGHVKFLYLSPERIQSEMFIERAHQMKISMLAIDEAHCISQWGYDFRPPYLKISEFVKALGIQRVVALTASATKSVKADILEKLEMADARVFQKSFLRANLSYSVFNLEHKEVKMLEILQNVSGSSVVYVRSRKQTKDLADFLRGYKISADYYHAGLPGHVRANRQDLWIEGKIRVIVATNAFGMGIDKADVRTVIHYDLPDSLEAYYQEAGRAGRDEKKAFAVQLYGQLDLQNLQKRAEQSAVSIELIRRVYQALANYYKLAVGSTSFTSYEFDYEQFVKNFDLPLVESYHAINKLVEAGLIEMSESFKTPSKVMFLMEQADVYKFQVANSSTDPVIKVLMRLYGGELFSDFVTVKEKDIATLLRESQTIVMKQLEYLHQAEVLVYRKASDKPQITFLTPRMDVSNLPLDVKYIQWRREVAVSKAKAVKEYVESMHVCRTRIIQHYFDEITYQDCGVCDICLARNKKRKSLPMDKVEAFIKVHEECGEEELVSAFSEDGLEVLAESLRYLMDQKRILLTKEERFRLVRD